jgi:hypothetical protein
MYAGDQTAAMRGERSTDPLRLLFLLVLMLNPLSVSHASSLVGSPVCGDCHAAQTDAWRASHHARAMQPAAPETINARWSDSFSHAGVTSRFERAGERFLVHTIDANGRPDTFPVRYTFGVEPLQQYLLEGPRGRRRFQSRGIPAQSKRAASAGLISFLIRGITVTRSTGAVERRTGTTCALTVM